MRYLIIGWLMVFSAGCSVTVKQPALHDFGLLVSDALHQDRALVTVNAPTWLWDNRIRYRLLFASPSQVRYYGLDRWIASPPELLEQQLRTIGKARNYALIIRLQDFEQQFETQDRARVVMRFSVEAYSDNQKIGAQEFYLQKPTKTPDAAGAISGFTDLTQQAVERIQAWLAGLKQS
ncbi:MAG: ABC-type transport auxiliary lipoprotein family protein [Gammaproteobacteria bacterium]